MKNIEIIHDRYQKARGGWSRILELSCAKCGHPLFRYQKDGPGPLKRLYKDRIDGGVAGGVMLRCPKCKEILGTAIIYKKEGRPAYRLFQDAVAKKITRV